MGRCVSAVLVGRPRRGAQGELCLGRGKKCGGDVAKPFKRDPCLIQKGKRWVRSLTKLPLLGPGGVQGKSCLLVWPVPAGCPGCPECARKTGWTRGSGCVSCSLDPTLRRGSGVERQDSHRVASVLLLEAMKAAGEGSGSLMRRPPFLMDTCARSQVPSDLAHRRMPPRQRTKKAHIFFCSAEEAVGRHPVGVVTDLTPAEEEAKKDEGGGMGQGGWAGT